MADGKVEYLAGQRATWLFASDRSSLIAACPEYRDETIEEIPDCLAALPAWLYVVNVTADAPVIAPCKLRPATPVEPPSWWLALWNSERTERHA